VLSAFLAPFVFPAASFGLDHSIPRIGGEVSRLQLGDGTGIVVGIVDSGIDALHPALAGFDSLGQPRLVAEANFVRTEPEASPDDVFGHGTGVAGVILSADAIYTGLAPDARFINSRVLDRRNAFQSSDWVIDGLGFAIEQGADVVNLSLNMFASSSTGGTRLDLAADWITFELGVPVTACAGNISQGANQVPLPRSPGAAYNVFSVGRTTSNFDADYSRVDTDSAYGPTSNGRSKPDLVAPGNAITTLSDDWETQAGPGDDYRNQSGCSFATPHVTGLLAQQLDYGRANGLSVDPLVLRSTQLNSAEKVYDREGNSWQPYQSTLVDGVWQIAAPYDNESGAGQVDGAALAEQYAAGRFSPGAAPEIGWDLNEITFENTLDYDLPDLLGDGRLIAATLTWARHVRRIDLNSNERIDSGDAFVATEALDNLDLTLLRNGQPVVASMSLVDNVEHIYWRVAEEGNYSLRVSRSHVENSGDSEPYSLAWRVLHTPPILGDTNSDGRVDLTDLNNVRNHFGQEGSPVLGDTYPYDGFVGLDDLNHVRNDFGYVGPFVSVPEPATGLLAFCALVALLTGVIRRPN